MTLTRKHFKQLAEHIKQIIRKTNLSDDNKKLLISEFILFCEKNNPRFNEDKFRRAIK